MAAKNSITVKNANKGALLESLRISGIEYKRTLTASKTHYTCTVYFSHFQQLFQAGFHFCKITGHSPKF